MVPCVRIFLRLKNIPLLCICQVSFFCLFISGHLGCFYLLAIINHAITNTVYKYLFKSSFSVLLGVCPEGELLGHVVILCLAFLRSRRAIFCSGYTISHSPEHCVMVPIYALPRQRFTESFWEKNEMVNIKEHHTQYQLYIVLFCCNSVRN